MALEDQLWDRSHLAYDEVPATGRKTLTVNGGTAIELGDTGLRDLSGMFAAGKVASGRVLVRRQGNLVTWYFVDLKLATGATSAETILTNGDGSLTPFGADYQTHSTAMINASTFARLMVTGTSSIAVHYGVAGVGYSCTITYLTSKPWPTTLPGVANGQPVGV